MTTPSIDRIGPHICPILVGRDDLLESAARRLAAARDGAGHLLLLSGEAGIGKTRLLGAIERGATASGCRAIRGETFRGDLEVAAAPFLDLARTMARTAPFRDLGDALLERILILEPGGLVDSQRRRRLLVLDIVDLLASVATAPTMLALENLCYADDLSLEILAGLARRLPELPLLVVGTYRSDELYPRVPMREWRVRLLTDRLAEEARLPRLSIADTAMMTSLILEPGTPAPRDIVDAVYARTDGIPLHVEELLGVLLASRHSGQEAVRAANVPDTLEAAVHERLAALSPPARSLAGVASVIGHAFDAHLLADLADEPVEQVAVALRELVTHFFVVTADGADWFDFRHALIREAIYRLLTAPERRRLHGLVADLAAARGGEADAFLSVHFELAGRREDAFRTALAGARWAAGISSHREAYELYQRALRNVPQDLTPLEHARALEECATAAAASDDNAAAAEAFTAARERYLVAGDVLQAAAVLGPLVAARALLGDPNDVRSSLLDRGLDELDELPSDDDTGRVRARLLAARAAVSMAGYRLDEAIRDGEEARALARALGEGATECHTLATMGIVHVDAGRLDEGFGLLTEAIGLARARRLETEAARGYRLMGAGAWNLAEYDRGERWLREGIEYAERVERWNDRHYMAAALGVVLWGTGRWDEAVTIAAHALADGRGGITTRVTAQWVLGWTALGRGDWSRARTLLGEALAAGERMGELIRISPPLWGLAETALLEGQSSRATELCERGRLLSGSLGDSAFLYPFLVTGVRAYLAQGDTATAERWVDSIEPELRRRSIPSTLPAIDHGRGLVLLATGSTSRARVALEAAIHGWDERRRAWEGTWARLDLASCLLRLNRPAEAAGLLEDVRTIGDRLGSRPLLARAGELLRAARARHPTDEPWRPLTAREFEVARLIAAGSTNGEIANELGIAPKTASAHVEHILAKLGASRRSEIAVWAAAISRGD